MRTQDQVGENLEKSQEVTRPKGKGDCNLADAVLLQFAIKGTLSNTQ
jgi:hypothetical protein